MYERQICKTKHDTLADFFADASISTIKACFSSAIAARANAYVDDMLVVKANSPTKTTFLAHGSDEYDVLLTLHDKQLFGYCSCLSFDSGANCKHLCAAMLYSRKQPIEVEKITLNTIINKEKRIDAQIQKVNTSLEHAFQQIQPQLLKLMTTKAYLSTFDDQLKVILKPLIQFNTDPLNENIANYLLNILPSIHNYCNKHKPNYISNTAYLTTLLTTTFKSLPFNKKMLWLNKYSNYKQQAESLDNSFFQLNYPALFKREDYPQIKKYCIQESQKINDKLIDTLFELTSAHFTNKEKETFMSHRFIHNPQYLQHLLLFVSPYNQLKLLDQYLINCDFDKINPDFLIHYIKTLTQTQHKFLIDTHIDRLSHNIKNINSSALVSLYPHLHEDIKYFANILKKQNSADYFQYLLLTQQIDVARTCFTPIDENTQQPNNEFEQLFYRHFATTIPAEAELFYKKMLFISLKTMNAKNSSKTFNFISTILQDLAKISPNAAQNLAKIMMEEYEKTLPSFVTILRNAYPKLK